MLKTLSEIKGRVEELAEAIRVPPANLPAYGYSEHTGRPHVDIDSQGYYYAAFERGPVVSGTHMTDIEELLYQIFADVTFVISARYELAHRVQHQDSRGLLLQHQVHPRTKIAPRRAERAQRELERILREHPFGDSATDRASSAGRLREQGYSSEEAHEIALQKYPPTPNP